MYVIYVYMFIVQLITYISIGIVFIVWRPKGNPQAIYTANIPHSCRLVLVVAVAAECKKEKWKIKAVLCHGSRAKKENVPKQLAWCRLQCFKINLTIFCNLNKRQKETRLTHAYAVYRSCFVYLL